MNHDECLFFLSKYTYITTLSLEKYFTTPALLLAPSSKRFCFLNGRREEGVNALNFIYASGVEGIVKEVNNSANKCVINTLSDYRSNLTFVMSVKSTKQGKGVVESMSCSLHLRAIAASPSSFRATPLLLLLAFLTSPSRLSLSISLFCTPPAARSMTWLGLRYRNPPLRLPGHQPRRTRYSWRRRIKMRQKTRAVCC